MSPGLVFRCRGLSCWSASARSRRRFVALLSERRRGRRFSSRSVWMTATVSGNSGPAIRPESEASSLPLRRGPTYLGLRCVVMTGYDWLAGPGLHPQPEPADSVTRNRRGSPGTPPGQVRRSKPVGWSAGAGSPACLSATQMAWILTWCRVRLGLPGLLPT